MVGSLCCSATAFRRKNTFRHFVVVGISVGQCFTVSGQHCVKAPSDGDQFAMMQVRPASLQEAVMSEKTAADEPEEVYRRKLFHKYIIDGASTESLGARDTGSLHAAADPLDKYVEVVENLSDSYGSYGWFRPLLLLVNLIVVGAVWMSTRRQTGKLERGNFSAPAFISLVALIALGCTCILIYDSAIALLHDAVETYDSSYLGVKIKVGRLSFSPTTGILGLSGVAVSNPSGYKHDDLLRIEGLTIDFDIPATVSSFFRQISVQAVAATGVHAIFEQGSETSNVAELARRVSSRRQADTVGAIDSKGANSGVVVDLVNISHIVVDGVLPSMESARVSLFAPDLIMRDFIKDVGRLRTSSDVIERILSALLQSVLHAVEG